MRFFDMVLKFHADSVKSLVMIDVKMVSFSLDGICGKEFVSS